MSEDWRAEINQINLQLGELKQWREKLDNIDPQGKNPHVEAIKNEIDRDIVDSINSLREWRKTLDSHLGESRLRFIDRLASDLDEKRHKTLTAVISDLGDERRLQTLKALIDELDDRRRPALKALIDDLDDRRRPTLTSMIDEFDQDRIKALKALIVDLDDQRRPTLTNLIDKWSWFSKAWAPILAFIGIASGASVFSLYQFIESKEAQTKKYIETKMDAESLTSIALQRAQDRYEKRFNAELGSQSYAVASATLTNLVQSVIQRAHTLKDAARAANADILLAVATDARLLLEQYGADMAEGKLSKERLNAVMHVSNGLQNLSLGRRDDALRWFELAINNDPTIPEPHFFIGRHYLARAEYSGGNTWRKQAFRTRAADRFRAIEELAVSDSPGLKGAIQRNHQAQKGLMYAKWVNGDLGKAIDLGRKLMLVTQFKKSTDATLYDTVSMMCWYYAGDSYAEGKLSQSEQYRRWTIDYSKESWRLSDSTGSFNNLIWCMTHLNRSNINGDQPIVIMETEEKTELQGLMEEFEKIPGVLDAADFRDTLLHARYTLQDAKWKDDVASVKKKLERSLASVRASQSADTRTETDYKQALERLSDLDEGKVKPVAAPVR